MSDSETLDDSPKKSRKSNGDDFPSMSAELFTKINFKNAIFLFLTAILVFSDIFIDNVLSKIPGASHDSQATTKGTMLQITVLVLMYLIIDLLNQGGCI